MILKSIILASTLLVASVYQLLWAQPAIREFEPAPKSESYSIRATKIIGASVWDEHNNRLGDVKDIILGNDDRAIYMIITRGGRSGVGARLCAVPWQLLQSQGNGKMLTVSIKQEQFENAPDFTNWADMESSEYNDRVQAYYGAGSHQEENEWHMRLRHAIEKVPQ